MRWQSSSDGARLYVANMGSDAVAAINTKKLATAAAKQGMVEPDGFIPTEWMPMSMATAGGKLYVATDKGRGTGPNNFAQKIPAGASDARAGSFSYIATLLYGSLAAIDVNAVDLKAATEEVLKSNRMKAAQERIAFAGGTNPVKHVIYVIKENRTYDQIFGDLKQNGRPVGNGDASLAMYGEAVTPNQHKLALQFGVLDNFFDSGEVSGDGHVWSNAAIGTDYLERVWQQDYRNAQRTYDFEGVVSEGYPLLQKIPDVNEPSSGYMWGNADAHGKTHYNFGEYISSTFCGAKKSGSSQEGPLLEGSKCARPADPEGRADSGRVGRRGEPVALADSADREQCRDQAGAGGPFCRGGAGLQSAGAGPNSNECISEAFCRAGSPVARPATTPCQTTLRFGWATTIRRERRRAGRRRRLPLRITILRWDGWWRR